MFAKMHQVVTVEAGFICKCTDYVLCFARYSLAGTTSCTYAFAKRGLALGSCESQHVGLRFDTRYIQASSITSIELISSAPLLHGDLHYPMATLSTPVPTILSCGDSPLSTTASIVGILTFALGLFASYIALQSATRGAPSEIARLVDDLRSTQHEINRVAEYIFNDVSPAPSNDVRRALGHTMPQDYIVRVNGVVETGNGNGNRNGNLYEEVQTLLENCVRLFYEADDLLKKSQSDEGRWDPEGLRRRIVFVMNRHEVGEKMQRLSDQKAKLSAVQTSLFMR